MAFGQITNPAPYCASVFSTNYNMFNNIKLKGTTLSFGAMGNWMPSGNNAYGFYNTTSFPDLKKSDTFSVQVNVFAVNDGEPGYFALWIDYNHDNAFDNSELILQNSNTTMALLPTLGSPVSPINKVLTVPATAMTGLTRARLMRGTNSANPYSPYNATFHLVPCSVTTPDYGCTYDFNVNISNGGSTGIAGMQVQTEGLEFYPNPASNLIHVKGGLNGTTIVMTDAYGRNIRDFIVIGNSIDISAVAPGMYYLQIIDGTHTKTTKLMVAR